MPNVRDLPKSVVVARLKVLWEEVELVNEPPIGHWPADEPTGTALDFPAKARQKDGIPWLGYLLMTLFIGSAVLVILSLCTLILPWFFSRYIQMCGC